MLGLSRRFADDTFIGHTALDKSTLKNMQGFSYLLSTKAPTLHFGDFCSRQEAIGGKNKVFLNSLYATVFLRT